MRSTRKHRRTHRLTQVISILGCGWLGLPLAQQLVQEGYRVKGSTRTAAKMPLLIDGDIEPYLIDLAPEPKGERLEDFLAADILVLAFPPRRTTTPDSAFHLRQLASLLPLIANKGIKVIYLSSIAVYPNCNRVVTESNTESLNRDDGHALLHAEDMILEQLSIAATVIRLAGLYGYDRHPVRALSGRKNLLGGDAPVNLIHLDDCIGILSSILKNNVTREILNGCSDLHPPKKRYYPAVAARLGLPPPIFVDESDIAYKIVSNQKLKSLLGYRFCYPSPYEGVLNSRFQRI